jgi:Fur family ferric uptake transcriptional regulator
MDESKCSSMLTVHGIKPTANRIVLLKALASIDRPMSLSELEYKILTIDKSNIFRALTTFKEHHLVHVIEDGGDGVRYELCHSNDDVHDEDMHAHFYCERCHKTFCLEDCPIPMIEMPSGYEMKSINYMVKGLCPDCADALNKGRG